MFGVRAGDVQFIAGDAFGVFEYSDYFHVIFGCVAENVGEYGGLQQSDRGQLFTYECAYPDVLQPDGIHHPALGFPKARWRISVDGLARKSFYDDAAELIQVYERCELYRVGVGTRGREYGVAQRNAAERCLETGVSHRSPA